MADPIAPVPTPASAPAPVPAPAAPARVNPFVAIGQLLRAVRISLESAKRLEQAPRWVRIDRVRQFADPKTGDADVIAKGVMTAMGAVTTAISYLQRFTLDATDLLIQGDAAKALVEVSADLVKQATSKEFINALEVAVGQEPSATSPIGDVGGIIDKIVAIADKVPEPEDLKVIGAEVFLLLAIVQLSTGTVDDKTLTHVDVAATGKLRLLHWGFWQSYTVQNLGKGKDPVKVFYLGARRLAGATAGKLPLRASATVGNPGSVETVYDLSFDGDNLGKDVAEANAILDALGYGTKFPATDTKTLDDKFAVRLRVFQKLNDIPVTGQLDNPTINRLVHLDYDAKNLKRAKPYREDLLPAGFDPTKAA
jgi:hypothetical protein